MGLLVAILLSWATAIIEMFTQARMVVILPYLLINPILLLIPRLLYAYIPVIKQRVSPAWIRTIEWIGAAVILVNAPGSLFLHDLGVQYDRFLHFAAAGLVSFIILLLILPFRPSFGRAVVAASVFSFIGLFIWELIQWSSDQLFGTLLFHDAVQDISRDMAEDILFGILGLLAALIIAQFVRPKMLGVLRASEFIGQNKNKPR